MSNSGILPNRSNPPKQIIIDFPCSCKAERPITYLIARNFIHGEGMFSFNEGLCVTCKKGETNFILNLPEVIMEYQMKWVNFRGGLWAFSEEDYEEIKKNRDHRWNRLKKAREAVVERKQKIEEVKTVIEKSIETKEKLKPVELTKNHWEGERIIGKLSLAIIKNIIPFMESRSCLSIVTLSKDWREAFIYYTDCFRPTCINSFYQVKGQGEYGNIFNEVFSRITPDTNKKGDIIHEEFFFKLIDSCRKHIHEKITSKILEVCKFEQPQRVFLCPNFIETSSGQLWLEGILHPKTKYSRLYKGTVFEQFDEENSTYEPLRIKLSGLIATQNSETGKYFFDYRGRASDIGGFYSEKNFYRLFDVDENGKYMLDPYIDMIISTQILQTVTSEPNHRTYPILSHNSPIVIEAICKGGDVAKDIVIKALSGKKEALRQETFERVYGHWPGYCKYFEGQRLISLMEIFGKI